MKYNDSWGVGSNGHYKFANNYIIKKKKNSESTKNNLDLSVKKVNIKNVTSDIQKKDDK